MLATVYTLVQSQACINLLRVGNLLGHTMNYLTLSFFTILSVFE